jgi:hypothetical protein
MSSAAKVLTPDGATRVLEGLRSQYGLGDKYRMEVARLPSGRWRIAHEGHPVDTVAPMSAASIFDWFDQKFGDIITDRLETSEG